jgi:inner membrane protein
MSLFSLFTGLGAWNWLILAVVLFALETVVPGVHFLWFGVAAALVAILAIATDMAWQWQLIVFGLIAVATVFIARRYSAASHSDLPDLNVRGAQYIGRTVTVEEPIRSGRGKVRVGDTVWQAEGPDSAAGSRVRVTSVNGTVLVVEREGA